MVARAHSYNELEHLAAAGVEDFRRRFSGSYGNQRVEVLNEEAVAALGERQTLAYRGRTFVVGPLSYQHGRRVNSLRVAIKAAETNPAVAETEVDAIISQAVELFHEIVRPRWLRWLPNPFLHASDLEVGELLGFFHLRRYASGVRFSAPPAAEIPHPR
jgi:hypothetical protein